MKKILRILLLLIGVLPAYRIARFVLRIFWHPVSVILFHAYILWNAYLSVTGEDLVTLSFAQQSSGQLVALGSLTVLFLHAIGLGLLWLRLSRWVSPLLHIVVYGMLLGITGYQSYIRLLWTTRKTDSTIALIVEYTVLFVSFMTALSVYSGRYLLSTSPHPLLPRKRQLKALLLRLQHLARSRETIAILLIMMLVINTGGVVFLWRRVVRIEGYLGGNLALTCDERQTLANTKDAIVRILTGAGEGTGMIIRDDGVVMTNAHVVDGEPAPKVILSDYSFKTAAVAIVDKDADVALLKIDGSYRPLTLADPEGLSKLDPLIALGYPLGTGLKGDATTTRGAYVTTRSVRSAPVSYIHFDGTINAGNSGGPLMTLCGNVVGMVTYGGPGISLAISSEDLIKRIGFLADRSTPLPVLEVLKLEPEKGPQEAVVAFYSFIKMRSFEKAYNLLSRTRTSGIPLSEWVKGYAQTLDVTLLVSAPVEGEQNTIRVKMTALDLVGEDVEDTYYEGTWSVVEEDGSWRLGESNIKKVKDPPFYWFWER